MEIIYLYPYTYLYNVFLGFILLYTERDGESRGRSKYKMKYSKLYIINVKCVGQEIETLIN